MLITCLSVSFTNLHNSATSSSISTIMCCYYYNHETFPILELRNKMIITIFLDFFFKCKITPVGVVGTYFALGKFFQIVRPMFMYRTTYVNAHQCRQFVRRAAICTDETIITLNILNPNEYAHTGQPTREGKLIGCAAWACSFEFKILRLIRILSLQIAAAVTNCLHRHYVRVIFLLQ